jgi:hypothetical protein
MSPFALDQPHYTKPMPYPRLGQVLLAHGLLYEELYKALRKLAKRIGFRLIFESERPAKTCTDLEAFLQDRCAWCGLGPRPADGQYHPECLANGKNLDLRGIKWQQG